MGFVKPLASLICGFILCFVPLMALAEVSHVELPNVAKDNAEHTLTGAVKKAIEDAGFTVYDEASLKDQAGKAGVSEKYWTSSDQIVKVNQTAHHDVVVVTELHPNKKPYMAVSVYDASTGKLAGSFKLKLKKKIRLSKDEKSELIKKLNGIFKGIGGSGAQVADITNDQEIESTASDNSSCGSDCDEDEAEDNSGKLKSGAGRPVFSFAFYVNPGIHDFKHSDETKLPLSHKTFAYPVFASDIYFFPFPLFSKNDYLQGLGISAGFGVAKPKLDTKFNYNKNIAFETSCTKDEATQTYTCSAIQYRIHADLMYRLLLQKNSDGRLNADGAALDFIAGFNLLNHLLDSNPGYNGNSYYGIRAGLGFSTPLGTKLVRLNAKALFLANFNEDDEEHVSRLGHERDLSIGANAGMTLMIDMYKGFFIQAGYELNYIYSNYKGFGCNNDKCTRPLDSKVHDMFHEIVLGLGYMVY